MATLTKSQITIVDTTDIKVQSSPPLSPSAGDRWINTGSSPYVLYVNDGAAWQVETDWDILQAFSMHDVVLEDITSDLRVTPFEKSQLLKILTPIFYDAGSVLTEAARYNLVAAITEINNQLDSIHVLTDPLYIDSGATSDVDASFDENLNLSISALSGLLSSTRTSIANSRLVGTSNFVLNGAGQKVTTSDYFLAKFYLSGPLNSNLDKYSIAVKADLLSPRIGLKIIYNSESATFATLTENRGGIYYTSSPMVGSMTPSPEGEDKNYIEIYAEPGSASSVSTLYWVTVAEGTQPMMSFEPANADLDTRMQTAEYSIVQQADLISNTVTRTEYNERIDSIGARVWEAEQLITPEAITSTVRNGLKWGGRNLFKSADIVSPIENRYSSAGFLASTWGTPFISSENTAPMLTAGDRYTLTYTMEIVALGVSPTPDSNSHGLFYYSSSVPGSCVDFRVSMATLNQSITVSQTFTAPVTAADQVWLIYTGRQTSSGSDPVTHNAVRFSNLKLEKGDVATDWSPAPEDVDQAIINEASSRVAQSANNIMSEVASTYLTKNEQTSFIENLSVSTIIRSDQWGVDVSSINQSIQSTRDGLTQTIDNLKTSFYVDINGAHIKKAGSVNEIVIDDDSMDIISGGVKAAWFALGEAYNEKLTVNTSLSIGDWQFMEDDLGNFNLRKIQ